ncbi:MAG: ergothioneine biosynthesis protein EgtB [Actinobacteria bacterium]|nr:MAG: ergothioneine biosynthesis protein EgtB [Actinomycetota bacterium]
MDLRALAAEHLEHARARTLGLLAPIPDDAQCRQVSTLMSPLVWDLAHIGHYEELWLLRQLTGASPTDERFDDIYDAFRHPRAERPQLDILDAPRARAFDAQVRARVLNVLENLDLDRDEPLLRDAFVYGMVIQHEHQHDETMLATIQLMDDFVYPLLNNELPPRPTRRVTAARPNGMMVRFGGGTFLLGADAGTALAEPWAYDNEHPLVEVEVPPFTIDVTPVTNAEYLAFILDGGYDDPRLWTAAGREWRNAEQAVAPLFWQREGPRSWARRRFGRVEDVRPDEPVEHVCWFEADAYCRWAGKRLPSEIEWELAASWDPTTGTKRRYPWGDSDPEPALANLGQLRFGPMAAGVYPGGASPLGCEQMIGDIWEWTSSDFHGYPGFAPFPYREYSEVFFGDQYKVLRGGSWATHPVAARATFRNWDFPIRRQIFSGFRGARDA